MGIFLGFISRFLIMLFGVLLFTVGCIIKITDLNGYLFTLAKVDDEFGNVVGAPVWNLILIKKDGYKFGKEKEKMSSVLGKNKEANKLIYLGKWLDSRLNRIDANHSIKSIDNNVD